MLLHDKWLSGPIGNDLIPLAVLWIWTPRWWNQEARPVDNAWTGRRQLPGKNGIKNGLNGVFFQPQRWIVMIICKSSLDFVTHLEKWLFPNPSLPPKLPLVFFCFSVIIIIQHAQIIDLSQTYPSFHLLETYFHSPVGVYVTFMNHLKGLHCSFFLSAICSEISPGSMSLKTSVVNLLYALFY